MKCYKGKILTIDSKDSVFNYLVEDKGRILYVGNKFPEKYKNAKLIDLGKKVLCPSFCDTHQHFASFSLFNAGLNVMDVSSNIEMKEKIKEYVNKTKDKLLIAFGASPHSVKEKRLITRKELDEVCPKKPFCVVKYDGHAAVINTKLLNKLEKKISNLRGFHSESGEMNQEAFFAISNYLSNSVSLPKLLKNMQKAIDYEANLGIGMIHTVSGVGFPFNMDITLEKMFGKSLESGFQLRVYSQSLNIKTATSRNLPRIGGCFECALDGCYGSKDAKLNSPYLDDPSNDGVLFYDDEVIIDFCKKANREGLQIEMHAIGDKAFDQATRCLKIALDDYNRTDHRHGIIHACLPTKEGLEICEKYKIQIPLQTAFINWKQEPDDYLENILGKERANSLNPLRKLMNHKIMFSMGSDGPCTDPNPISWLYKACNHTNKNQSLTIKEALRVATYNGYWTSFDEKERGSLEVGKIADMVILSENPYELKPEKLMNLKVEETILNGEKYKKQSQSIMKIIFKGLFSKHAI